MKGLVVAAGRGVERQRRAARMPTVKGDAPPVSIDTACVMPIISG
jgi:hypothetical protein